MDQTFKHLLLGLLVVAALIGLICAVTGCITIERVQVGPDHWPGATTQSAAIGRRVWEDFEDD